jgi:hypothetical protein
MQFGIVKSFIRKMAAFVIYTPVADSCRAIFLTFSPE